MQVRTFTAATMREAMAQVRAEMGADAVILSSDDAQSGVSLRAAAERRRDRLEDVDAAFAPRFAALEAELERRLLSALHKPKPRAKTPAPATPDGLAACLAFHEIDPALAATLSAHAAKFAADGPTALGQALDASFAFTPLPPEPETAIALIGTPGAGKTASAAKLAVRAVLAGRTTVIISTDDSAGAVGQIETFAGLIRANVISAPGPQELADAVAGQRTANPDAALIIDTAGINPLDRGDVGELRVLLNACDVEPVWVTPASGSKDLEDHARIVRDLGAKRLIATRLDVARRLGSLINAAHAAGLAFAQCAASPYIAETLEPMNAYALARRLLSADMEGVTP